MLITGHFAADVAQLVEQLIRNQQVRGSSPRVGSSKIKGFRRLLLKPFFIFFFFC